MLEMICDLGRTPSQEFVHLWGWMSLIHFNFRSPACVHAVPRVRKCSFQLEDMDTKFKTLKSDCYLGREEDLLCSLPMSCSQSLFQFSSIILKLSATCALEYSPGPIPCTSLKMKYSLWKYQRKIITSYKLQKGFKMAMDLMKVHLIRKFSYFCSVKQFKLIIGQWRYWQISMNFVYKQFFI